MTNDEVSTTSSPNLMNIPEYVLRILLSYMDATTLYQLSQTCVYLKEFVEDPIYWKYIDARGDPNTDQKVSYIMDRMNEKTTHIFLRCVKRCGRVPLEFFEMINRFENLRILVLENQKIYGSKVGLKDFPPNLEEISLKKTFVKNSTEFFRYAVRQMQKLRVLILDECSWVTSSFMMSVSKFESLEIISAVKCMQIHLNMVPYLTVAKYGCKKLKVLDFRFTGIGGEVLRSFSNKPTIQNMYFQSFGSSEVDYNIKMGSNNRKYQDRFDDHPDQNLGDVCMIEYTDITGMKPVESVPKSLLYKDPYPDCTCQNIERNEETMLKASVPLSDDFTFAKKNSQLSTFVCNKHMKDVQGLPENIREFFYTNQSQCMSDVTSDVDSDSDSSSDSDDERSCCVYAMGSKMIFLPTARNVQQNAEIITPPVRQREDVTFNIVVLHTDGINEEPRNAVDADANPYNNAAPGPSHREETDNNRSSRCNGERSLIIDIDAAPPDNVPGPSRSEENDNNSSRSNQEAEPNIEPANAVPGPSHQPHNGSDSFSSNEEVGSALDPGVNPDDNAIPGPSNRQQNGRDPSTSHENKRKDVEDSEDSDSDSGPRKKRVRTERETNRRRSSDNREPPFRGLRKVPRTRLQSVSIVSDSGYSTYSIEDGNLHVSEELRTTPREQPSTSGNNPDFRVRVTRMFPRDDNNPPPPPRANDEPHSRTVYLENAGDAPRNDRIHGNEEEGNPQRNSVYWVRNRFNNPPPRAYWDRFRDGNLVRFPQGEEPVWPKRQISLRRLSLRGYKRITDETLRALQNLELELLDLTYTSVTAQGIEEFLSLNPNCRIIHPFYCICKPRDPFLYL